MRMATSCPGRALDGGSVRRGSARRQHDGRGVAVSKSDFATYTFALRALQAAAEQGARFDGTVELHFTYDEEAGGAIGPQWLLAQKLTGPISR